MTRLAAFLLLFALLAAPALAAPETRANGVPQLVKLSYIPGISNFGPQDAEGLLEFSFAERYARAEVKNLVPEAGYSYEGWMRNAAGNTLFVGAFTIDAAGIGSMEATFEGIDRYDYNLFVVAARPADVPAGTLPGSLSVAGSFTIVDNAGNTAPSDSRPLELPETGQLPEDDGFLGLSRAQAAFYAMGVAGVLIIVGNALWKRRSQAGD